MAKRRTNSSPQIHLQEWSFNTKSRCPACGSLKTHCVSTQGQLQYRKCRRCGNTYKERGRLI